MKTLEMKLKLREKGESRGKMRKHGKNTRMGKLAMTMWCLWLGEDGAETRNGDVSTKVTSRNEMQESVALMIIVGTPQVKQREKTESYIE